MYIGRRRRYYIRRRIRNCEHFVTVVHCYTFNLRCNQYLGEGSSKDLSDHLDFGGSSRQINNYNDRFVVNASFGSKHNILHLRHVVMVWEFENELKRTRLKSEVLLFLLLWPSTTGNGSLVLACRS